MSLEPDYKFKWREEFDLRKGEVRRITLARTLLRRGIHSRNRFELPPLRIGQIVDCDVGEYAIDYALPDFDKVGNVASPCNEYHGLVLLKKQESPRFFVAWGTHMDDNRQDGSRYIWDDVWCKVLPVGGKLSKNFASAKEWGRHPRFERASIRKDLMDTSLMRFYEVSQVDRKVLDLGGLSREVLAEVKRCRFLGGTFVELTIHVKLPPEEN